MRLPTILVVVAIVGSVAAPASGDEQGPPFDYASGPADAQTGLIGAAMARTGVPLEHGLPGVQAGTIGLVGVGHDAPASRVEAWATVDAAQLAALDPDAALCIRIAAPASGDLAALPNIVEGGGPVCRFLAGAGGIAHTAGTEVRIRTFADLSAARSVGAEVFVSWKEPHPRETGATGSAARVLRIGFAPAT